MKHDFRILVVDDDQELRQTINELLSREGYRVEQAVNGKEAAAQVQKTNYDLVISDMVMPEISGIDLLKTLKQSGNETPLLMITGHTTIEDAVEAIKLGAEDYIAKPFDGVELLTIIKRLYENKLLKERS